MTENTYVLRMSEQQTEIALRILIAGLTHPTISDKETNILLPALITLYLDICRAKNVKPNLELFA